MKQNLYETLIQKNARRLNALQRKLSLLSFGRIASFLLFLGGMLLGYFTHPGFYFAGWASFAVFVALIWAHSRKKEGEQSLLAERRAIQGMLDRKSGAWRQFSDDGAEFLGESCPPRGKDLDLFSKNSLYQYLCRCHTSYGRRALADRLRSDAPGREQILQNQQAVRELAQREEFSLALEALGILTEQRSRKTDGEAIKAFLSLSKEKPPTLPVFWRVGMWLLPFVTLFFLISAVIGVYPSVNLGLGFMGVLLQLLAAGICWNQNNRILAPLLDFAGSVGPYRAIFEKIKAEDFRSAKLAKLQQEVSDAAGALKALASAATAVEARKNPFGFLFLGGLLMWDFHCADRFCAWTARYGEGLSRWLAAVGEIEADMSLAVPANVRRESAFPSIEENGPVLRGDGLKHPLLPEETAVGNSISLGAQTCVITGSNMSGKTTFLRSVGLNFVLACAGGPVAAGSLTVSPMALFTSMRVEDDVSAGISTFYAELLRIKEMVAFSGTGRPMLCLIDEIFKGTNSADRIYGATETIRRLSLPHSMILVSTHDFELCNLENDPGVKALNFHFSEQYTDGGIRFDYRMSPGRCRTTNAQYLLKMAGIL